MYVLTACYKHHKKQSEMTEMLPRMWIIREKHSVFNDINTLLPLFGTKSKWTGTGYLSQCSWRWHVWFQWRFLLLGGFQEQYIVAPNIQYVCYHIDPDIHLRCRHFLLFTRLSFMLLSILLMISVILCSLTWGTISSHQRNGNLKKLGRCRLSLKLGYEFVFYNNSSASFKNFTNSTKLY